MSVRHGDLTEKWYEYVYRDRSRVRRFVEAYPDERSLSVSYDRFGHDYQFVEPLLSNPDDVLRAGRDALSRFLSNGDGAKFDAAYLRVNALPERRELSLAELRAEHLNELYSMRCTVIETGPVRPKVVVAAFRCAKCERVTRRVAQPGREFREHAKCPRCNSVGYLTFEPEDSEYVDAQTVEVGDAESDGDGDANRVVAFLEHDLAGTVESGDGVRLVGIPRAERTRETTVADRWVEAVSMEHLTPENP